MENKEFAVKYAIHKGVFYMFSENIKFTAIENRIVNISRIKVEPIDGNQPPVYFTLDEIYSDSRTVNELAAKRYWLSHITLKGIATAIKMAAAEIGKSGFAALEHGEFGFTQDGRLAYGNGIYLPNGGKVSSVYSGKYNSLIKPLGTLDECIEGIKKLIAPNNALCIALLSGLSGAVVYNLSKNDIGNSVLGIMGESSSSKTIMSKVAVFSFGSKKLIPSGTSSSISGYEKLLKEYGLIPLVIEDITKNRRIKKSEFESIIRNAFDVNSGILGNAREVTCSVSPTIINDEKVVSKIIAEEIGAGDGGHLGRYLEINIDKHTLTKSAPEAEILEEFMNLHSGQLAPEFLDYLYSGDVLSTLDSLYTKWRDNLRGNLTESKRMNRLTKMLAVIMVTGELFNARFGDILYLDAIAKLLEELAEEQLRSQDRPLTPRDMLERFINDAESDGKISADKGAYSPAEHVGFRGDGNVYIERIVLEKSFEDGFSGFKDRLISDGIVVTAKDANRSVQRKQIKGQKCEFYMIRLGE